MTVRYHDRSEWQTTAEPVNGGSLYTPQTITQGVVHWPGGGRLPSSPAAVPAWLRDVQHDYLTSRGYSIGYNEAVCFGERWELRGFDFRCAANSPQNLQSFAVLMVLAGPASPADLEAARTAFADASARSRRPLKVIGHRDIEPTACPGDGAYAQLTAGLFDPMYQPPTPTPTPGDPMDTARLIRFRGFINVFLIGAGTPLHATGELVASWRNDDVPAMLIDAHAELMMQCAAAVSPAFTFTPGGSETDF